MIHEGMHTLRISTKGSQIHNLLALRIKEYDRNLARVSNMIELVTNEVTRTEENANKQFQAAQERARQIAVGRHHESVGMSEVISSRAELEKLVNGREVLLYQRSQVVWLRDQFEGDKAYELDVLDLNALGLSAELHGFRVRGVFDPLDL